MTKEKNNKAAGVFQLPNGNWGYRFIVTVEGKRKAQKRIFDEEGKPFKTEAQAAKSRTKNIKLAKLYMRTKLEEAAAPKEKKIEQKTVQDVYAEYCEKGRSEKAYATKKKQDSLWKNYLLDRFGERYINEISVAEINDFLAELYIDYNFAYSYVEGFLKQFYLIFGQAYSRNYLKVDDYNKLCVNKNTKIKMPKMKSTDIKDIAFYSKADYSVMDKYFHGKNVETAYLLGRYCGLRVGECYGVLWSDINFEKGYIMIDKQFKSQDGLNKLLPLKTKNARRKVYMCSELQRYLEELREKFQEYEKKYALQREQNEMQIFNVDGNKISSLLLLNTLPNGKIQTDWAIKHHARPLKEKYGIDFKYHILRHTYGTNLALLNTPAHILRNQMGHGKSQTTQKYYLAVSEEGISELKYNLEKI